MSKTNSVFFHQNLMHIIRKNALYNEQARESITEKAAPWLEMTNDQLWSLVFSSDLKRAYHVRSDGDCPSCHCKVPLFNWIIDVWNNPYKVQCPDCKELFPKNDFSAYYQSGIERNGNFSYTKADRSLLKNTESTDPDQLYFGVDDGNGYTQDGHTWMFIAYYMLFGQWTQLIFNGIKNLAKAYVALGDPVYARKACILLDRVADVFPDFDFMSQGIMYDRKNVDHGYVSYWFVSCLDVRDMALAYDQIFDSIKTDCQLVSFLHQKSLDTHRVKNSFGDIQENIESRIFRDAIVNRHKIKSNVPQTDITQCMVETVLDWPNHKEKIMNQIDFITKHTTAVDGTTGEKGLVVYTSHAIWGYSNFLWYYENMQPGFIEELVKTYPVLKDSYQFFIDTWCLQKYYPRIGDTGAFAQPDLDYAVLYYSKDYYKHSYLDPCIESVLWKLYEVTQDADFAKIIYISNKYSAKDAFKLDLSNPDNQGLENMLDLVIQSNGFYLKQKSVNKTEWRLALLHSGEDEHKRTVWLNYDSGGHHGHHDGLTMGLFAKGLDLMPDFGYPPVHLGWDYGRNPKFAWYRSTAAHNTVSVDMQNHITHGKFQSDMGQTLLWAIGNHFKAVTAACSEANLGNRFERTLLLSDISREDCYIVDLFRVEGGTSHTKFMRSSFGKITKHDLDLLESNSANFCDSMRHFSTDPHPIPGWSVTWQVDDSYFQLHQGEEPVYVKYTDISGASNVMLCESWVDLWRGKKDHKETGSMEDWIPTLITRKTGSSGFHSTFASVIEPFEGRSTIRSIKRVPITDYNNIDSDINVALKIDLENGLCDYLVFIDPSQNKEETTNPLFQVTDWELKTDAQICIVRVKVSSESCQQVEPVCITVMKGSFVHMKNLSVKSSDVTDYFEVQITDRKVVHVEGTPLLPVEISY